ncbi:hypothetical protein P9D36_18035 [Bacillus haynesii]|uniref:hypothetical protein n=1 Tax=Bacillus haynesii TaxID=1925021 RepID=UPI001594284E|nr:hypothetical protein [Bacillus haynesii]NVB35541.1 hypothetical protein [Bacillus licheniformis]MCY7778049.1 hypothetical protein [Bacillus haynesii]MCY7817659.1 hypothetical protein [Bacillus haynesii]MCY8225039.1 hypothetical protein [Bacillus haynesii]MCY8243340.1 hypothetical protein [Bacillus haynesii]
MLTKVKENTAAAVLCFVFPAVFISHKDSPTTLLNLKPRPENPAAPDPKHHSMAHDQIY